MQIPNDPVVWVVLIAVVAAILGFALWRRYNVVLRKGDTELRLERSSEDGSTGITVGKGMRITGSQVGDITGAKVAGGDAKPVSADVASGARIENSKVGDIAGVIQEPPPGDRRS
ncbi:MAG: hypothetical protein ACREEP_10015 [Dongiaceae bacterium]